MSLIIKSEKSKAETNVNIALKKWLRENEENVNLELINLTTGDVLYIDPKTSETLTWNGSGDKKAVPLATVFSMLSNSKLLHTLSLGISDYYYKGKKALTLKEIIECLELEHLYSPFDYDITDIDTIIMESKTEKFREICEKCNMEVIKLLISRYKLLFNLGYVNDRSKEAILSEYSRLEYLWD